MIETGAAGHSGTPRVAVFTDIPSPYQVELFNTIAGRGDLKLQVIYARCRETARPWPILELQHTACFLDQGATARARTWIESADLAVFSGYRLPGVQSLIRQRCRTARPWVFWGERPGLRFSGFFGRCLRRWPTRHIRAGGVPIWGIGEWALEGYREELGADRRLYINVPYFSDLGRFTTAGTERRRAAVCRFLFSGQLSRRKGVDVLIGAFQRLAAEDLPVELHLLGDGPLRPLAQRAGQDCPRPLVVHGYQPWQSLPDYYRNADFLCAPSRHDGWALVVPEGLAAGLPVIASDRTGAARQLLNADNGWLIPANDGEALYAAMKQAAQCSSERYLALSANARAGAQIQDLPAGVECFSRAVDQSLEYWRNPAP